MLVSRHAVLADDLNIDMLSTCAATANYQDLFNDFNLVQHVTSLSRVAESSLTLTDHIVSTSVVSMLNVKQALGLSDHHVQIADIDILLCRGLLWLFVGCIYFVNVVGMMFEVVYHVLL